MGGRNLNFKYDADKLHISTYNLEIKKRRGIYPNLISRTGLPEFKQNKKNSATKYLKYVARCKCLRTTLTN
jgi:hypothetical protein